MNLLGNIIWIIFGGLAIALEYVVAGFLLCLTIIGIPFGLQSFKLGMLALVPFGQKSIPILEDKGCLSALMNVIWFFIGGIWITLTHLFFGVLLCLTIIGIPFGKQHFKLMSLAFAPFGRSVVSSRLKR
ncbi:MAG: YccF domain-containing protein [Bacteroidales bacterium]|nr:YccF domain-containing protein [Bacteroidales bacterium]